MVGATALLAAWAVIGTAVAGEVPQITRPVTDLAEVLRADDKEAIARELVAHREATGVQLAVLIVDTTHGHDIADFAQTTFTAWGGGSMERNDGALFVLAIADRRSRLHLGYGLEPVIPDAVAKRMLDALRPHLHAQDYARATRQLVNDVVARTAHLEPGAAIRAPLGSNAWLWLGVVLLGVAAGIAWGVVFTRAWRARKPCRPAPPLWAFLVRRRPVQIVLGVLAAVTLLLSIVFRAGDGFGLTYSMIFWIFVLAGWVLSSAPNSVRVPMGIVFVFVLLTGYTAGADLLDGAALRALVAPRIGGFWLGSGLLMFMVSGVSSSGSSSSSSYSSSSSSSSSSYSSSSSSSSSSSGGGSSYSSSSYSGGGGSSGGGGASSSW